MSDKNKPKRENHITVYPDKFRPNLKQDIEKAAKKAKMNKSNWMRKALGDAADRQK